MIDIPFVQEKVIEIFSIFMIGIFVGVLSFFRQEKVERTHVECFKEFFKCANSGGILALSVYLLTDALQISNSTRLGLAIFIAFAGYEKLEEIINKLIDFFMAKKEDK